MYSSLSRMAQDNNNKADSTHKRIEDASRCGHCFLKYRDPRLLSCGHSFCKKCIAKYVVMKSVSCFECEEASHVPNGDPNQLIKNLALMGLVDTYQNPYASPCLWCAECRVYERREAVERCSTCNKSLCSLCSEAHSNLFHAVISIAAFETETMEMRDMATSSLGKRTEAKTRALEQRLRLVSTQTKRVRSSSSKLTEDIYQSFNKYLKHIQEQRDMLLEATGQREEFLLKKLQRISDHTHSYMETLSKISATLILSNKKRLRGEAQENYIALSQELERLLHDDIDLDMLQETSAFAEGFSFRPAEMGLLGTMVQVSQKWRLEFNQVVPNRGAIRSMCGTPDGRIAVGYSRKQGGLSLISPDGTGESPECMKGVLVRTVSFLPDGQCAILATTNHLCLYSNTFESLAIDFKTLGDGEAGTGQMCVDEHHFIYVAYSGAKKIQVFSPLGGNPDRIISFSQIEPIDIRVSLSGDLLLVSWRRLQVINQGGETLSELSHHASSELIVADVCRDESIIVACIAQSVDDTGKDRLTVHRYQQSTSQFKLMATLFEDQPIEVSPVPFYCVRELVTGEIAFCTKDRLYLFQNHTGCVQDVAFSDYTVGSCE